MSLAVLSVKLSKRSYLSSYILPHSARHAAAGGNSESRHPHHTGCAAGAGTTHAGSSCSDHGAHDGVVPDRSALSNTVPLWNIVPLSSTVPGASFGRTQQSGASESGACEIKAGIVHPLPGNPGSAQHNRASGVCDSDMSRPLLGSVGGSQPDAPSGMYETGGALPSRPLLDNESGAQPCNAAGSLGGTDRAGLSVAPFEAAGTAAADSLGGADRVGLLAARSPIGAVVTGNAAAGGQQQGLYEPPPVRLSQVELLIRPPAAGL